MKIQSSMTFMASKSTVMSCIYREEGGSFLKNMEHFGLGTSEEDEPDDGVSECSGPMAPLTVSRLPRMLVNDTSLSPSDELSMRLALLRHILSLLLRPSRSYQGDFTQNDALYGSESFDSGGQQGLWRRTTEISFFRAYSEETSFESKGTVKTEDGREIDFGVSFTMSRSFSEKFAAISDVPYVLMDPLVINLSSSVTSVSDRKFYFDLDCDGEEESISFAGEGSGFLALDRNGDGVIGDGSELFGTKSGDGFGELAEYDEDNNGWIDENDDIFDRLRVWMKDESGKDILLSLKEADVGAISLASVSTPFSLRDEEGALDAVLGRSGVYLHESTGQAGYVSHVDLAAR